MQSDLPDIFFKAVSFRDAATVKDFLTSNPELIHVRHRTDASTALHFATAENRVENALILLNAGADVDAKDADGNTPLHYAVWGREDVVTLLLRHGADMSLKNKDGYTAEDFANFSRSQLSQKLLREEPARRAAEKQKKEEQRDQNLSTKQQADHDRNLDRIDQWLHKHKKK